LRVINSSCAIGSLKVHVSNREVPMFRIHRSPVTRLALLSLVAASALVACAGASPNPSPAPSAAAPTTVAMGTFHDVDGTASGTAAMKHLPDGSFAVVFEDFAIESAANTNVVLVPATDITASSEVDMTQYVDLGALKGTSGMQDYQLPSSTDGMGFHTVVLWDTAMMHALAAAPLQ
jgi:hypothetical protein